MNEKIIITKSDKTNLIEIRENQRSFYLTLTNNDLIRIMLLSNQLKKGETRNIEKD